MRHVTKKPKHTLAEISALLAYDPKTGVFNWRTTGAGRPPLGGEAGGINGRGHRQIMIDGVFYLAHRLAWLFTYGVWPVMDIDHIDRDPVNNRIANLRLATCSQNGGNARISARNTSGIKGVCWHKNTKKWQAQITVNRRNHALGYFDDINAACAAYRAAAQVHFGVSA